MNLETGVDIYTLPYIDQIVDKNVHTTERLLSVCVCVCVCMCVYSTGNPTQYSVIAFMGKESFKKG